MKSSVARRLAEDFIKTLKYNPQLTEAERILSLESRLAQLITDVENGCIEAQKRQENNRVIVDSRPEDIQPLSELMIKDQAQRGVLFN